MKSSNIIRKKFIALSIFAAVIIVGVGGVGKWASSFLMDKQQEQILVSSALKDFMNGDMMHDAIRGDVLIALKASESGNKTDFSTAEDELKEHSKLFRESIDKNKARALPEEISKGLGDVTPALNEYIASAGKIIESAKLDYISANAQFPEFIEKFSKLETAQDKVSTAMEEWAQKTAEQTKNIQEKISLLLIGACLVVFITMVLIPYKIIRWVFAPMSQISEAMRGISQGKMDIDIPEKSDSEIGVMAAALMEFKNSYINSTRLKLALDSVTSNVMMADVDLNIIYMNESLMAMFRHNEKDIQKDLPRFSVDNLIGSNIDIFHKNPAHQRAMLAKLTGQHKASIQIGGRDFNFIANVVFGGNNERIGTIVEWVDATEANKQMRVNIENEEGMNEAVHILTEISNGNLALTMKGEYLGTFADIKRAVNATIEKLVEMVNRIKDSAQSVTSASSEISAGSNDLSQRTEQQASSLEETAASMEEITGTVRANSENAKNANQLSAEASNVAQRGGKVAEDAVCAMKNIEKSSQKIADIISVIDEIAFQTNLLALNAAVEAARAGEAGKGFAVVASEVRSLAGRSASASKEIKALIMESNGQVKTGAELVNQAGDTLKDIVTSVKKVSEIIAEITAASVEQATGIDEINSAISQMDEVTQQNAALVEENTAAAQSLVHQAQELDVMMQFFKISEENAHHSNATSSHETRNPELVVAKKAPPRPIVKPVAKKMANAGSKPAPKSAGENEWEEF